MKKPFIAFILVAFSLAADAAAPDYIVLGDGSQHSLDPDTSVLLVGQVAGTAWFRIFVDGTKICDIRQPRPFYVCPYTTPLAAGTYSVEVRTNPALPGVPGGSSSSFTSNVVIGGASNSIVLTPDSMHSVEPSTEVTLLAQVSDTAWFRIFANGTKICDIRQPRPIFSCSFNTPAGSVGYDLEVRTNSSLNVTADSPNRSFFSRMDVAGADGNIYLQPDSIHNVETGAEVTFSAEVPNTQWFRLFVNGSKICDVREALSLYRCDYTASAVSGHYNVEVRTNESLMAGDGSPNQSFFSTLAVVSTGYVLHFDDEFNDTHGGRPNPEYWDYSTGAVINNERQCYTDDHPSYTNAGISNVRVETRNIEGQDNGYLVLELKREDVACRQANGQLFNYTSGAISTRVDGAGTPHLVDMPFGIYEVRAKIPSGRGTWPAIWLLGKKDYSPESPVTIGWPDAGEIDMLEAVGFEEAMGLYRTHHTLHRNKDGGFLWAHGRPNSTGQGMTHQMSEPPSANFHVYKMIWKPESIEMFVDGVRVRKMDLGNGVTGNRPGFFRSDPSLNGWGLDTTSQDDHLGWPWAREAGNEFRLILNLAFGGGWGGQQGLDNSIFASGQPVEMLIDYVRVYAGDGTQPGQ